MDIQTMSWFYYISLLSKFYSLNVSISKYITAFYIYHTLVSKNKKLQEYWWKLPALLWKNEIGQFSKAPQSRSQTSRCTVLFYFFIQFHLYSTKIWLHQHL